MTHSDFIHDTSRSSNAADTQTTRVLELAKAGAEGRQLTPSQVRQVCEALQARKPKFRNNFHGGVSN